jgi:hypothetical protein
VRFVLTTGFFFKLVPNSKKKLKIFIKLKTTGKRFFWTGKPPIFTRKQDLMPQLSN